MRTSLSSLMGTLLAAALAGGCASTLPTERMPAEGAPNVRVTVQEKQTGIRASVFWLESGASGSMAGAALGFAAGTINPYMWLIGGPFVTTPLGAWMGGRCGAAVARLGDVATRWQEIAGGVDLAGFRSELDLVLGNNASRFRVKPADPSYPVPTEITLEIHAIELTLGDGAPFCGHRPLRAKVTWRAIATDSGQELASGTSSTSSSKSYETVEKWFDETKSWLASTESSRAELALLMLKMGREVADNLFSVPNRERQRAR